MQTTPHTASQPRESAPEHRQFKTREQELWERDRRAWAQAQLERPILAAIHHEARSAERQNPSSRVFFERCLQFFREAELLELPVEGEFLTDWFALAFEGAYELASEIREQAEAWLDEFSADRQLAEAKFRAFKKQARQPNQGAHHFVKQAIQNGHFDGQPAKENNASVRSLISGVEAFFWTGLFAATEARNDPEAAEVVEWFDGARGYRWNDERFHIRLIRQALQSCRNWSPDLLEHPLLRVAREKYRRSPQEGAAIGGLLECLCRRSGIQSERQIIWRELNLAQWIRDGVEWGAWFLRNHPAVVEQIIATTHAFTGDDLERFYQRLLKNVSDIDDFIQITIAFIEWQSDERGGETCRYHGERLDAVVECVDAAVWLPWWLAHRKCDND